tara:strand:- start:745 stop:1203 length:459 start_codon:yes stop_codon:yes gene_type:complete
MTSIGNTQHPVYLPINQLGRRPDLQEGTTQRPDKKAVLSEKNYATSDHKGKPSTSDLQTVAEKKSAEKSNGTENAYPASEKQKDVSLVYSHDDEGMVWETRLPTGEKEYFPPQKAAIAYDKIQGRTTTERTAPTPETPLVILAGTDTIRKIS